MKIIYDETKKDLPVEQLHSLFVDVGWSDGGSLPEDMKAGFIKPWIHSTLVVSAWTDERLIGAVRVLSDTMFRSIIYDLLVLPKFQNKGIGKELVKRCIERFPNSEWLVQTTEEISGFYKKNGFIINHDAFLTIPCKLFSQN